MFSTQLKTIFRVLGTALLTLANMPAEGKEHVEMTGQQYIDGMDNPATGTDLPDNTTGSPAQVFATAIEQSPEAVAAVFSTPTPGVANGVPNYIMTEIAGTFTREQYHDSGWTDEALIEAGMMIVEQPPVELDNSPNVQPEGANTSAPAPSAQATASTQAAPQAAPQNTAAQAPAGGATPTIDSTGLPWDARIHAGTRTTNNDGTWKKKKGTGDVYYNQVVAELRGQQPAPAAAPQPFVPLSAHVSTLPAPAAPAAPAAAGPTTFADLCKMITANGFTMPQALEHAAPLGITAMGMLAQPANAAHIPTVWNALLASRK